MISTVETLKRARARIADEQHWTKYVYSDNRDGHLAYCALGAIRAAAASSLDESEAAMVIGEANHFKPRMSETHPYWWHIGQYNDTHSHTDVLRLFDKAIAKLEKRNA